MSPITVNPMCPEGIKSPHEEKERPSEGICEITSTQLRLRRGFKRTPAADGRYFRDGSGAPDPAAASHTHRRRARGSKWKRCVDWCRGTDSVGWRPFAERSHRGSQKG